MFMAPGSHLNSLISRMGGALLGVLALALSPQPASGKDFLHELDSSMESLVQQVTPAVVQVLVTGYGAVEQH